MRGMIIEDQLDCSPGRISGIEKLEEFDELSAAMAISNQGVDLAGEQINPSQQAERAVTPVLMITREGRVNAGHRRQVRRRCRDGLDPGLLVVGDDCHRLAGFLSLCPLQDFDLTIDAEDVRHLLLEFGVPALQVVAHLVRPDFLPVENLTNRALNQLGQAPVPGRRAMLPRMASQKASGPQLMRISVLSGLVACQGDQPSLRLRRDRRLFARPRPIIEGDQGSVGQCPLDTALDGLVMGTQTPCHRKKRRSLPIGQKHPSPLNPARWLRARTRYRRQYVARMERKRNAGTSFPGLRYASSGLRASVGGQRACTGRAACEHLYSALPTRSNLPECSTA